MEEAALRAVEKLEPGEHLCSIYETEAQHRTVVTAFLLQGLERNHKIIYLAHKRGEETLRGYLTAAGVDPDAPFATGRVEIISTEDSYVNGGVFDPEAMISLLEAHTQRALDEGYDALRVTGEMTWAIPDRPGTQRLIEYESRLSRFLAARTCVGLCQYDKRRFHPSVLLDVLRTHPDAVVGTEVYDNFYYLPPEDQLREEPEAAELENWLGNLRRRAETERALEREKRFADAVLETSGALILVLDTGRNIVRSNRTCREISGYSEGEMRRIPLETFVPEEEREGVEGVIEELLAGTYPNTHENHWITRSGEKRFIAWTNTVVLDENDAVESIIATGIDITDRIREERNRIQELEAEIARLEELTAPGHTRTTGHMYAQRPLKEARPADYSSVKQEYATVLLDRLEERMYKTDNQISPRLQHLARTLGRSEAGPKDVVEMHVSALRELTAGVPHQRAKALTDEGRLLALELMGYLVSVYRNQVTSTDGT